MDPTNTPIETLPATCTLCYYPFSVYSIITRFAFVLGQSLNSEKSPSLEIRLINLQLDENLEEDYLALNSKGQVPTLLASPDLKLTDSFDIVMWLCEQLPELIPADHRQQIQELMKEFYTFHARALTAAPDDSKDGFPNRAAAKLELSDISDPHRRRLEIKSVFHDTIYGKLLDPDIVEEAELKARRWCQEISRLRQASGSSLYLFGDKPSILDAFATTLIARLMDLDRDDLIPDSTTREYGLEVMKTEDWRKTTFGRRTIWSEGLGPVHQLWPI